MSQLERIGSIETDTLLHTKLAPPRLHTPLVAREALLARLDAGLECKLTLLSAPAGFGKTTLVRQWLAGLAGESDADAVNAQGSPQAIANSKSQIPNRVAWLSLDEGDNDPVRFWRYVLTACQSFQPDLGQRALTLLRTSPPPFEALLTTFINELDQLPGQGVLVLEDYHLITSAQIHDLITFCLDHLPSTLHLLIITRSDPPLPLARLRARNELNELGAADLRFSLTETQTFLHQALPFPLVPEMVARLDRRTEGWAAGLRLVALTLQGQEEPEKIEQVVTTFTGSHRPILEYLITDVFNAQPEPLQEFLLQTSVLSRLTGSLCDAVTGRTDSELILEQLERANLFLLPLDAAGEWYRFHALFAEAMQHYARQRLGEARLRELAHQASHWYEAQGMLSEATEAALAAQAFGRAATLIERIIIPNLVQNEYHTLGRWMERLPEEVLRAHPTLCMAYAQSFIFTSNRQAPEPIERFEKPLRMVEEHWRAVHNEPKLGETLALRAIVSWLWYGDLPKSFSMARQALALLPENEVQWRGISLTFMGVEEMFAGRLTAARQTLAHALALNQAAGNIYATIDTTIVLGELCARQGALHQSAQFFQQALAELERVPMDRDDVLFRRGWALLGLGALALEWNKLETAEQNVSQALVISRQFREDVFTHRGPLILARCRQAHGETTQAQQRVQSLIAQTKNRWLLREAEATLAWLALATNDLAAVQRWSVIRAQPDDIPRLQQEQESLIQARLLIAQGETDAALRLLEPWQAEAQIQGRTRSRLEMLVLQTLAHERDNHLPQAKVALHKALADAQPEGYQRLFLDEGEPMGALLRAAFSEIKQEPLVSYVRDLLLAFAQQQPGPMTACDPAAVLLLQPLTPQEQRVLRLLAAGLSNPEIARELIVSVNTVKTQVQSIYRKLNVNSRQAARDAARHLNLR